LAQEAIGHLLEHEERFIDAIEKGLASLDRGEFVSHEDVARRIENLLRS
jgi:predicted transcriptional regulator